MVSPLLAYLRCLCRPTACEHIIGLALTSAFRCTQCLIPYTGAPYRHPSAAVPAGWHGLRLLMTVMKMMMKLIPILSCCFWFSPKGCRLVTPDGLHLVLQLVSADLHWLLPLKVCPRLGVAWFPGVLIDVWWWCAVCGGGHTGGIGGGPPPPQKKMSG